MRKGHLQHSKSAMNSVPFKGKYMCVHCVRGLVAQSCPTLRPHGLQPVRLVCPWNSPGKNTGVDCHSFLQRTFPTQGLNPGLLHYRKILYHLSYREAL